MNRMHAAKGLRIIEAPENEFPPSAYFDFVACCELAFLSMGTLTVERPESPVDVPPTNRVVAAVHRQNRGSKLK
jgi:hypothetical protein